MEPSAPAGGKPPAQPRAIEVASVERWRGYARSTFVLAAADGTVYESAPFRWRRAEPPADEGEARAAYDLLVEQLLADGWTPGAQGDAWFETSFERPTNAPVEMAPQPEPEQAPPVAAPPQRLPLRRVDPPPAPAPPAAVAVAAAAPAPSRRGFRPRPVVVAVALGSGAIGLATGALLFGGGQQRAGVTAAVRSVPVIAPAVAPQVTKQKPKPKPEPVPPRLLHIAIVGVRGRGSWVEARLASPTGKLLYSGFVAVGQRLHLRGRRVWARFGAAGNLAITVDGKLVSISGTYDKTFRSRG